MNPIVRKSLIVMGVVSVVLAALVSIFASSQPDGLERVAMNAGFIEKEKSEWSYALLPDYSLRWLNDHWLGTTVSGLFGLLVMFAVVWLLFKWLAGKRN